MTGVIVAYCHQEDGKSDVPKLVCILLHNRHHQKMQRVRCCHSLKHIGDDNADEQPENDGTFSCHQRNFHPPDLRKTEKTETARNRTTELTCHEMLHGDRPNGQSVIKYKDQLLDVITWKQVAAAVNRLMLTISCCISIVSIITIICCFIFMFE